MLEKNFIDFESNQKTLENPSEVSFNLSRLIREDNERCYRFVASLIGINDMVLDLGCGSGLNLKYLNNSKRVFAIDISSERIRQAKKENEKFSNIEIQQMDALSLHFPNSFFDKIIAMEIIEHIHDAPKILSEISRVLKENGMLILSTPNQKIHGRKIRFEEHVYEYNKEELRTILEERFSKVEILGLGIVKKNFFPKTYSKARETNAIYGLYKHLPFRLRSVLQYSLQRFTCERNGIKKLEANEEAVRLIAVCCQPKKELEQKIAEAINYGPIRRN